MGMDCCLLFTIWGEKKMDSGQIQSQSDLKLAVMSRNIVLFCFCFLQFCQNLHINFILQSSIQNKHLLLVRDQKIITGQVEMK